MDGDRWNDLLKALDFVAGPDGADTGYHAQAAGMKAEDCLGIFFPTRGSSVVVTFQGLDGEILRFGPDGRRP